MDVHGHLLGAKDKGTPGWARPVWYGFSGLRWLMTKKYRVGAVNG